MMVVPASPTHKVAAAPALASECSITCTFLASFCAKACYVGDMLTSIECTYRLSQMLGCKIDQHVDTMRAFVRKRACRRAYSVITSARSISAESGMSAKSRCPQLLKSLPSPASIHSAALSPPACRRCKANHSALCSNDCRTYCGYGHCST